MFQLLNQEIGNMKEYSLDKICAMLEELIAHIDYDKYKEIFVYEEMDKEYLSTLAEIVRKHLEYE